MQESLDSALGRDSTRTDAHFLLGVANQQLGMTDGAIRALEQPVRIVLTDAGIPVSGGLYRVRVRGMDASGRLAPSQLLYVGVVRQRAR